jgi:acyl-coenzyme A synthetase/AMP-(fatty) acid ligase
MQDEPNSNRTAPGGPETPSSGRDPVLLKVEEVLLSHASVLDAQVSKVLNDQGAERLLAAVTLKKGHAPSEELRTELAWYVTTDLGSVPSFKDIEFHKKAPPRDEPELSAAVSAGTGETVHVSGHPIDTEQVRGVLLGCAGVRKAAVSGVEDVRRGQLLDAVVELEEGVEASDDMKKDLAWTVHAEVGPMALFKDIRINGNGHGKEEGTEQAPAPAQKDKDAIVVVDNVEVKAGGNMEVSSHRISTTEVTKALLSHPSVMDAAALTVPDAKYGESLKAFVKLKDGVAPSNDLKLDLAWHVMAELKPVAIFKNIELDQADPVGDTGGDMIDTESLGPEGKTVLASDVERTLEEHDSVSGAVVIGVPDKTHGEALQAFVTLRDGVIPSDELREELAWHARTAIGPDVVFKFVEFRKFLPRADSQGSLRSILKADVMDIPTRMTINVVD